MSDDSLHSLTRSARELLRVADDYIDASYSQPSNAYVSEGPDGPPVTKNLRKALAKCEGRAEVLLGPLLQRQASIIARAQHLRTQSAEAKARGDAAAMRAVRAEIEQLACDCGEWAKEFAGLCVEQVDELLEIFPDNPVGIFSTVGKNPDEYATWFKPNRLYLDVTDGQLADVREVWSLVEHAQIQMTEQGHSRKRRRGARGLGKITTRWLARTQAVGQQQAYAEFVDEWKQRPEKYPAGYTAREWWHERIEPRLEKDRQI